MKITKRQLKRIILEAFKHRGLIREMGERDHEQDEILADAVDQYGQELIAAAQNLCYLSMQENPMAHENEFGTMIANGGLTEEAWNLMCSNDPETGEICQAIKDECKMAMGISGGNTSSLGPNNADIWFAIEGSGIAEAMEDACWAEIGG